MTMQKAKKYDWKDSNMALFGSDTERKVKKESAMTEPAWEGAGQEVGIQIWRIVKFQVTSWPKEEYGSFYGNDSYIILNTYKKNDSENLLYDLHFWIGATSTQDEYGTAAYKTVELDTFLDDLAVQHREVQDHESSLFKSYFKTITIMKGGAETGFRHVEPKEYVPRLLQFNKQDKNTTVVEVPFTQKSLDSTDVFVLDAGTEIFQWHGTDSNAFERIKAGTYVQGLESDRGGINTVVLEEGQGGRFYELLPDEDIDPEQARDTVDASDVGEMKLLKVSDAEGSIAMSEVKSGTVSKEDLGSDDVYLVDTGLHVFVYVGSNASTEEKRNGLPYAQKYIMDGGNKPWVPVTVVREGQTSELDNQLA